MTLRFKTLLAIGAALAALLFIQHLTTRPLLLEGFRRSEEEYLRAKSASLQRLLEADVQTFHGRFGDWAYWDDMYEFAGDSNEGFIESNLNPESMALLGVHALAVIRPDGEPVYATSFDPATGEFGEFPADLAARLRSTVPQAAGGQEPGRDVNLSWPAISEDHQSVSGILLVDGRPAAVSVRPILTSTQQGPARGIFLVAQSLESSLSSRLSWISGLDVRLITWDSPEAAETVAEFGDSDTTRILWKDESHSAIQWPLRDLHGSIIGILSAEAPRRINEHALRTAVFNTAWLVGAGLAFGVTVMLVMQRMVLSRVVRLASEVALAGELRHESRRVTADGNDELGRLARSINGTLEALTAARRDAESLAMEAQQAAAEAHWQRSEASRLAMVAERTGNGVIIADAQGRIEWVNAGFYRMTGYTLDEARGKSAGSLLQGPGTDRAAVERMAAAIRDGIAFKEELTNYSKDGREFKVLIDAEPLHDGEGRLIGYMAIESDVTELREAERRAAVEGMRLAMFIEHAPAAVAMFDREMRYITTSRRWVRDYGLEDQEIIGRSHYEVFPDIPARWREIHQRCLAGAVERCDEDCFERSDGRLQWLRWEVRPWMTPSGEIGGLSMFTEDLTDQRDAREALRRSEERFDLAVRGSNDGLWDWNHETDEVHFSPRYCEQLGYSRDEIDHSLEAFWEMVHPEDRAPVEAAIRSHREEGAKYDVEFRMRHKSGEWRWMQSRGVSVRDDSGRVVRMVGFHTDVTDRREATDRLKRYADDLAEAKSTLEARTRELEEAMRAAEAASRAKSDFLANMSHEIRTPMSAILGYAEMITMPGLDQEEQERCIETVRRNGEHLLTLINDILDLSKIEAERMTVELVPCEPASIIEDAAAMFRMSAQQKGLELRVEAGGASGLIMKCDPHRLRQVVVNLIGNAIKFTEPPNGRITVRAVLSGGARAAGGDEALLIEVEDTGIGISAEQVSRLFRPFTQADSSMSRRFGGTGLGLTISKRLIELMGGTILVRSEPGRGSVFTVRLPVLRAAAAPAAARIGPPAPAAGAQTEISGRVLLAEDGPDNQRLINFHLSRAGLSVEIAPNGRAAVDAVSAAESSGNPFDLILMDMQMPVLDGYGATAMLRQMGCRVPIISLTAHAMAGDREKCLAAGCDDHFTKPIQRDRLIAMVAHWISRKRSMAA